MVGRLVVWTHVSTTQRPDAATHSAAVTTQHAHYCHCCRRCCCNRPPFRPQHSPRPAARARLRCRSLRLLHAGGCTDVTASAQYAPAHVVCVVDSTCASVPPLAHVGLRCDCTHRAIHTHPATSDHGGCHWTTTARICAAHSPSSSSSSFASCFCCVSTPLRSSACTPVHAVAPAVCSVLPTSSTGTRRTDCGETWQWQQ